MKYTATNTPDDTVPAREAHTEKMHSLSVDEQRCLYACPNCRGSLDGAMRGYTCIKCGTEYPVIDGMILFATAGSANNRSRTPDSLKYEHKYGNDEKAVVYAHSFKSSIVKQRRTARELRIVSSLMSDLGGGLTVVNVPCGGGRLSAPVARQCRTLIEADISPAQASHARQSAGYDNGSDCKLDFIVASATELPFPDHALDGAVCVRLSHHLPQEEERGYLVEELARVSSRFLIISFTDRRSLISLSRAVRGKPLNPCSMAVSELKDHARRQGMVLTRLETVTHTGSRHRFALMERR